MFGICFLIETYSVTTRFILTCNYIERIIDPIQSRCQTFKVIPPSKKDVAIHVANILQKEQVEFQKEDLVTIINTAFPDIRKIINTCQLQTVNGILKLDHQDIIESNYMYKILEILKTESNKQQAFIQIRQVIADSGVRTFESLYRFLYDELDNFAQGHIASTIIIIADAQLSDVQVVDREINVAAMFVKLLNELK